MAGLVLSERSVNLIKQLSARGVCIYIRPFAERNGTKRRLVWIVTAEWPTQNNTGTVREEDPNLNKAVQMACLRVPGKMRRHA